MLQILGPAHLHKLFREIQLVAKVQINTILELKIVVSSLSTDPETFSFVLF